MLSSELLSNTHFLMITDHIQLDHPEHSRKNQIILRWLNNRKQQQDYIKHSIKHMKPNSKTTFQSTVIGVDLGSSSFKIAAVEKGSVQVITNEANFRQTPTVVGYGANERLIGESGFSKIKSNFMNTIICPNRYLGFEKSNYTQLQEQSNPISIQYDSQNIYFNVKYQGKSERILPEQATAALFTQIDKIIQINKLNPKNLVIAVPAYYTQHQKESLLHAVSIAKKNAHQACHIQLINESTAVALDYGYYKKAEFEENEKEAKNVVFIDFGHSKLSVYVVSFTKNEMKLIYEKHHRQLGCKNLDSQMLNFYGDLFVKQSPELSSYPLKNKRTVLKLLENIEKQRKVLTGISEFDFTIECLFEEQDLSYTMRREQFQLISEPIILQIKQFLMDFNQEITARALRIDSIELIGGGSRIPFFIRNVHSTFQIEPSRTLNSNQCIARGACLLSAMNSSLFKMAKYPFQELVNQTINFKIKSLHHQKNEDEPKIIQAFTKGENFVSKKIVEVDLPRQEKIVEMTLFYADLIGGLQEKIVRFTLEFSPDEMEIEGSSRKILFEISFDQNLILSNITAQESFQEQMLALPLKDVNFFKKITQEELKNYQKIEKEQMLRDQNIIENYERKNQFQSFVYGAKQKIEQSFKNGQLKEFISPQLNTSITLFIKEVENKMQEGLIEQFEQASKQINLKIKDYFDEIELIKNRFVQFQQQLNSLENYIESILQGKVKTIRFYPEELNQVKKWVQQIKEKQHSVEKYEQTVTTIEQIKQKTDFLNKKIKECQEEQARKEEHARRERQMSYQHPHQYRQAYNPFGFSDFGSQSTRNHDQNRNRRGNTRSNPYNSGFFSGPSGFF